MTLTRSVRRSVTLPAQVARQVDSLAKRRRLSDNRVLVELIEEGIEASKQKEKAFFDLVNGRNKRYKEWLTPVAEAKAKARAKGK